MKGQSVRYCVLRSIFKAVFKTTLAATEVLGRVNLVIGLVIGIMDIPQEYLSKHRTASGRFRHLVDLLQQREAAQWRRLPWQNSYINILESLNLAKQKLMNETLSGTYFLIHPFENKKVPSL